MKCATTGTSGAQCWDYQQQQQQQQHRRLVDDRAKSNVFMMCRPRIRRPVLFGMLGLILVVVQQLNISSTISRDAGVGVMAFETPLGISSWSSGRIGSRTRMRTSSLAAKSRGNSVKREDDGMLEEDEEEDLDDFGDMFLDRSDSTKQHWHLRRTMDTALCVIPPDDVWDDIQRARHVARDPTFYRWPPAIRLFHPFLPRHLLPDAASSLADLIDRYRLEPFTVTLDRLSIIPHLEELEGLEDARGELPEQDERLVRGERGEDGGGEALGEADMAIVEEEKKGREKLKKRMVNRAAKVERMKMEARARGEVEEDEAEEEAPPPDIIPDPSPPDATANTTDATTTAEPPRKRRGRRKQTPDERISPTERLRRQKEQQNTFNGPCIICLEPDDESKLQLLAFREVLRKKAFMDYDPFSASSTLSKSAVMMDASSSSSSSSGAAADFDTGGLPRSVLEEHGLLQSQQTTTDNEKRSRKDSKRRRKKSDGATFRPLLTLGKFSTVTAAVKVAKQIQRVWEPLTFDVTDLHLVSRMESDSATHEDGMGGSPTGDTYTTTAAMGDTTAIGDGTDVNANREYELRKLHGTTEDTTHEGLLMAKGEYGCDAMVMLSGEEGQLNEVKEGVLQIHTVDEDGEYLNTSEADNPAGGEDFSSLDGSASTDEEEESPMKEVSISNDMEELLADDEDWDEGATIVVGRTQFYMGESRQYVGMPASSTMDGKDRILGEEVSANMRRRGSTHRKANRWDDGDFGMKLKDKRK